jgi:hypothetical protein
MEDRMKTLLAIAAAMLTAGAAAGQQTSGHDMSGGMSGMNMSGMHTAQAGPETTPGLHQGGQAAFAAIAEATAALEADPSTDWSKANVDALRQHLVDMDNVTLHAEVARSDVPGGARFAITSADPRVRESIDRMVPLHSRLANRDGPYHSATAAIPNGTMLTVTGPTGLDQAKIRGLGFFGLLTEGVHHELHHMMLAKGEPMNH